MKRLLSAVLFFGCFLSAEANVLSQVCRQIALFDGAGFYSLDPLFESLGIDRSRVKVKRIPVLVDPRARYVRYFVLRTVDVGTRRIEISNFENQAGIFPEVLTTAKAQGLWPNNLLLPTLNQGALDQNDLLKLAIFLGQFSRLPFESLLSIDAIVKEIQGQGLREAGRIMDEVDAFILRHEIRRDWTPSFYQRLQELAPRFAGSTTRTCIRDLSTNQIVSSLKFIRAPYGGRTMVGLEGEDLTVVEDYGAWGPHYKALAAPSIEIMASPDHALYAQSRQWQRFSNHVLVPRMMWESYVPEPVKVDRLQFRSRPYETKIVANPNAMVLYWQHELVEVSGFAIDEEYAERNNAYDELKTITLAQLLDPSYSEETNAADRTYLFPNDRRGKAMFHKYGFRPYGDRFMLFGMPNWQLQIARGHTFAEALRQQLRKN